jgi:hypothetical protein
MDHKRAIGVYNELKYIIETDNELKLALKTDNELGLSEWLKNRPTFDTNPLLRHAVDNWAPRCIITLLKSGADPNLCDCMTGVVKYAIEHLLEFRAIEHVLRCFVEYGVDLAKTRLFISGSSYNEARMNLLSEIDRWIRTVEWAKSVYQRNGFEQNELQSLAKTSITCGSVDGLKLLLKRGLDPNSKLSGNTSATLLMYAVNYANECRDHGNLSGALIQCIASLMEAGGDPFKTSTSNSRITALSIASGVAPPNIKVIKVLLDNY